MGNYRKHLVICVSAIFCWCAVSSQFAIPEIPVTGCGDQYFDFGILSCGTCGTNRERDSTGYSCTCQAGFRANAQNPRNITCTPCGPNQFQTSDGYYCAECSINRLAQNEQECITECPNGTELVVSVTSGVVKLTCDEYCPASGFRTQGSCTACPECCDTNPDNQVDGLCFNNGINTISVVSTVSVFIQNNLRGAVGVCTLNPSLRNQTACEQLSNMCVMEHYERDSVACTEYEKISGEIAHGTEWIESGIPWLYYEVQPLDSTGIKFEEGITTSYKFSGNDKLDFVVAMYRANGTFLGISGVENGLIQLCKDKPSVMNAAYAYGTSFQSSCTLDAASLWNDDNNANIYFDMFLRHVSDQGTNMLYPIPVLVTNFNQVEYVRRFFLIDNIYGVTGNDVAGVPSTVRYAKSMSIN